MASVAQIVFIMMGAFSGLSCIISAEAASDSSNTGSKRFVSIVEKSKIPKSELSLFIAPFQKRKNPALLAVNEDLAMNPASISKVWIAGALLEHFKPGHTFITEIQTTGQDMTGRLKGDLYIRGLSDPSISTASIWEMIHKLKQKGVTEIQGDLVLDDSFISEPEEKAHKFGATIVPRPSAFTLDENLFEVSLYSDSQSSQPRLVFEPPNEYFIFENKALIVAGTKPTSIVIQQIPLQNNSKEKVVISGVLNRADFRYKAERQVLFPTFYFGFAMKALMKQIGISFTGGIRRGNRPNGIVRAIAFNKSPPIEELVAKMNKESRNFFADSLTMHLSTTEPKSIEGGLRTIKQFNLVLGINDLNIVFESPSGLSRQNRLSSRTIVEFLSSMVNSSYSSEFVASLAINGQDGTLRDRLKDPILENRIRAKTGQLADVISIAGYVWTNENGFIPFAFIYNGTKYKLQAQKLFDQLLIELAESPN